jgi:hypothetical protein
VALTSKHRMGVSEALWRKWMLSMTTLLLNQDGMGIWLSLIYSLELTSHSSFFSD